jgi:hypothetical protein
MILEEAKIIVQKLKGLTYKDAIQLSKTILNLSEAIRLVCEAACCNDNEAIIIQNYIPDKMSYIGLYPHVMKSFKHDKSISINYKIIAELIAKRESYKKL